MAVAWFPGAGSSYTASNFSATIQWGDNQSSSGTIVPAGTGGFYVYGSHSYNPLDALFSFGENTTENIVDQWTYYKVALRIEGPSGSGINYGTASQVSLYTPGVYYFYNG
jgi:hypothetical protein